jgi:hypothetical protein
VLEVMEYLLQATPEQATHLRQQHIEDLHGREEIVR